MKKSFKSGAASFYIVAFTTLILLVVSLSFASVVISLVERASNNDLSQSAYDSAMAGVEDAKTLFFEYRKCKSGKSTHPKDCDAIVSAIENESPSCDTLNGALGKIGRVVGEDGGVLIEESSQDGNNMQQMYTCLKIKPSVGDVISTFERYGENKVIKVTLENPNDIGKVKSVWLSWGAESESNVYSTKGKKMVVFPPGNVAPPAISVALVQTSSPFTLDDFQRVEGKRTNLGMVFLVPVFDDSIDENANYYKVEDTTTAIGPEAFLNSNLKVAGKIKPYVVKCDKTVGCRVGIELPEPIGGDRINDTFMFVLSSYGESIMIENGNNVSLSVCTKKKQQDCGANMAGGGSSGKAGTLKQTSQFEVDSTGRANDLYRRVVSRFNYGADSSFLSLLGPLELMGDGVKSSIEKPSGVTVEHTEEFK